MDIISSCTDIQNVYTYNIKISKNSLAIFRQNSFFIMLFLLTNYKCVIGKNTLLGQSVKKSSSESQF